MDYGETTRPMRRWSRVVIPAVAGAVLLTVGGVLAIHAFKGPEKPSATAPAAATPHPVPFTGTYRVDYGPATDLDGTPNGSPPSTTTWGVRSACRPAGCVATASRLDGESFLTGVVFDEVGGRWVAVNLVSDPCTNPPAEFWAVFTLQPRSDGTLDGEYSMTSGRCRAFKRAVTLTRTGDVDVNRLSDPAIQPPRLVSPAAALRGTYHMARAFRDGNRYESDMSVRTDCLRTGDRCMSFFHRLDSFAALEFDGATWTVNEEADAPCPAGGTSHRRVTAVYPLPAPPQDPISLLTGKGRQTGTTGSACTDGDFTETIVRTSG